MTLMQRIQKILGALIMVLCAVLIVILDDDGFIVIAVILFVSLVTSGVRSLYFYFTMARHMVDGRGMLYRGLILLDLGIFSFTVLDDPRLLIVLYLLAANAFSGIVDILRALEARKLQAPSWQLSLASGVVSIALALAALFFGFVTKNMQVLIGIYIAGLLWSALLNLISAFRKTAIVYIA